MTISTDTPLEKWLKKNGTAVAPCQGATYYERYVALKRWLGINIYPHIGEGAAAQDGYFYNKHGVEHFDCVLRYAGHLIGINPDEVSESIVGLSVYEVFLLMCAILVHDAGMAAGRDGHEKRVHYVLKQTRDVAIPNDFEKKIIADIAEVHGGVTESGDKDTIGSKGWKQEDEIDDKTFRAKLLAGIVRFADEIGEDNSRAASFFVEGDSETDNSDFRVPKGSEVFHKYCLSIKSVRVVREANTLHLSYWVKTTDISKKYGKIDSEVYLLDEIFSRLQKLHTERLYCNRFTTPVVDIRRIRVSISIVDGNNNVLDELLLDIEETGYPNHDLRLKDKNPDWTGDAVAKRYAPKRVFWKRLRFWGDKDA